MKVPEFLSRLWRALAAAGTLYWVLFSLGLGGILSSIITNALDLHEPWLAFFFIGAFLALTSIALPLSRAGFMLLATVLPRPPEPPKLTVRDMATADRQARERRVAEQRLDERRRTNRAALHEAMTTLEHHRNEIANYGASRTPNYQGEWGENRTALAGEPRYDRAVRATEQAFDAISYRSVNALQLINVALVELQAALDQDQA